MQTNHDNTGKTHMQCLLDRFDVLLRSSDKSTRFYRMRKKLSATLKASVTDIAPLMLAPADNNMQKQYANDCKLIKQHIDLLTAIDAFKTTLVSTDLMSLLQMRCVPAETLMDFEMLVQKVYEDLAFLGLKAMQDPSAFQNDSIILTKIISATTDLYAQPHDAGMLGKYLRSLKLIPAKHSLWREYFPLLKLVAATALFIIALLPPLSLGLPLISVGLMLAAFGMACVKIKSERTNVFETDEKLSGLKQLSKKTTELQKSLTRYQFFPVKAAFNATVELAATFRQYAK